MIRSLQTGTWDVARRLLVEHLEREDAKLVKLIRVGSYGARASFRTGEATYESVEVQVPREVGNRVQIDGALAFALLWEADWVLTNARGRLEHGELSRKTEES